MACLRPARPCRLERGLSGDRRLLAGLGSGLPRRHDSSSSRWAGWGRTARTRPACFSCRSWLIGTRSIGSSSATAWMHAGSTGPLLGETESWHRAVLRHFPASPRERGGRRLVPAVLSGVARRAARRVAELTGSRRLTGKVPPDEGSRLHLALDWMPAMRYQPYWSRMPFFALPSFYDGRVRVNLKGRERKGRVTIGQYPALCDEKTRICCAPVAIRSRGKKPSTSSSGPVGRIPARSGRASQIWSWCGRAHTARSSTPRSVVWGPAPFRRPGGHTGRYGVAYVRAPGIVPGTAASAARSTSCRRFSPWLASQRRPD